VSCVIGVDGGGTHMRAVIVDTEGRELGRAESTGAVVTVDDPSRAAGAVRAAVRVAAEQAGVELPGAFMWAGLAGAGSKAARDAVAGALDDGSLSARLRIGTDVEAAFHDAFGDGPGILVIAGTGSIAWARSPGGAVRRIGGWGRHLGDEGGGFAIGTDALRRLTWAEDGRAAGTDMRGDLLERCGVDSVDGLIAWIDAASKLEVAALAPVVVDAADAGDPAATEIVADAIRALTEHVRTAVEVTGPWLEPAPLVLWGGLLAEGGPLRSRMIEAVREAGVRHSAREIDPPMGAARLALSEL
jgi:N-acetylglucosamine kinase-like BadF-type ATPase